MPPVYANIGLLIAWYLLFFQVIKMPELSVLFVGFQAAMNLLATALFFVDQKKAIASGFLLSALISGGLTIWGLISLYTDKTQLMGDLPGM